MHSKTNAVLWGLLWCLLTLSMSFRSSLKVVPVGMSRGVKKLMQEKFPNMSKLEDISELLMKLVFHELEIIGIIWCIWWNVLKLMEQWCFKVNVLMHQLHTYICILSKWFYKSHFRCLLHFSEASTFLRARPSRTGITTSRSFLRCTRVVGTWLLSRVQFG